MWIYFGKGEKLNLKKEKELFFLKGRISQGEETELGNLERQR